MFLLGVISSLVLGAPVVVANTKLHPGEPITARQLYVVDFPDGQAPPSVYSAASELIGRVPRRPIWPHHVVRPEHLAPKGSGSGTDALLHKGETLVHITLDPPRSTPAPGDRVDVAVHSTRGLCMAAQSVRVAAAELPNGKQSSRRSRGPFTAAHLAVPIELAPELVAAANVAILLVRNGADTTLTDLPSCVALIEKPTVVQPRHAQTAHHNPDEPFSVTPLTHGSEAYLGWLELGANARIGPRVHVSELLGVVIEGHGELLVHGEVFTVHPGDAIYLPAHAEYSFHNGPSRFRMVEAFADRGVSEAYDLWPTPIP